MATTVPSPPVPSPARGTEVLIGALLFVLVMTVFFPSVHNGFVAFDDNDYVYENAQVRKGLTWEGARWAFTTLDVGGLWHPLTWLSRMLDCQLFGLHPSRHHLTGLLLHAANTVLLFLALRRLTGATWRCAAVAALFAVHPLHVETVAWVSDRKDTLSTLFWILTLWAYWNYVRGAMSQVSGGLPQHDTLNFNRRTPTSGFYWLALILFVCGLMSKPTVMILPVIMLMLDWWPLQRLEGCGSRFEGIRSLIWEKLPFFAAGFVCAVIGIYGQRKLGVLQTATQFPIGDRIPNALLSYLHYLAQTFWPFGLAAYYPYPKTFPILSLAGAVAALLAISFAGLKAARSRPYLAVGWVWYLVVEAVRLRPVFAHARNDLGVALALDGNAAGAETNFAELIRLEPLNADAHYNLANTLAAQGKLNAAAAEYAEALRLNPQDGKAQDKLQKLQAAPPAKSP